MEGFDKALAELKKEIVETRNLVIRNDNLLKTFGADLKTIGRKQENFERKQWISSAIAYVLFVALASGAAYLASQGYLAQAQSEIEALTQKAQEATLAAKQAEEELAKAREASQAALAAYQKLVDAAPSEREAVVAEVQAVDKTRLSRLEARALEDRARAMIQQLANEKFESGRAAYRRKEWRTAVDDLLKGMSLWPDHPLAPEHAFFLGTAANETRQYELVEQYLTRYIEEQKGRGNKDYAYLLLGNAQAALGKLSQAEATLRRGVERFPSSQFAAQMSRRAAALRKEASAPTAQTE
jgi:TolA-binding protein